MSNLHLRRTLLALAIAAACPGTSNATPAPASDVTHDLSLGRFIVDQQTFNNVTLIGNITSRHATPFDDIDVGDLQAITVLGNFTNKASITVEETTELPCTSTPAIRSAPLLVATSAMTAPSVCRARMPGE